MEDFFKLPKVQRSAAERIARGERAKQLLDDAMFNEVHETAQRRVLQAWRGAMAVEERERAWAASGSLGLLQVELKIIVQDGEHARASEQ